MLPITFCSSPPVVSHDPEVEGKQGDLWWCLCEAGCPSNSWGKERAAGTGDGARDGSCVTRV